MEYGKILNSKALDSKFVTPKDIKPILLKQIKYENIIPIVKWTKAEVTRANNLEFIQYAIIGKFTEGWPELEDLRKNISTVELKVIIKFVC